MRILHVIPGKRAPDTSTMVYARRQTDALVKLGGEHTFHYLGLTMTPAGIAAGYKRLRQAVDGAKPDLIHAHFGSLTALLCVMTGPPVIISFRGSDINHDPSVPRWRSVLQKVFSRIAARRAIGAIFVSEQLMKCLPVKCAAIVLPDGIDTETFKPIDRSEARAKLGWPLGDKVVLWNGGPYPQTNKRRDLAIGAVNEAALISGENIWPYCLKGTTNPEMMPLFINAADCVLMTSDYEGSPNITKEALSCGVPVVSVDVGDVAQQIAMVDGCEIAERSDRALGEAIVRVMGKASNGRERVLSCQQAAERIAAFYRKALVTPRHYQQSSTPEDQAQETQFGGR